MTELDDRRPHPTTCPARHRPASLNRGTSRRPSPTRGQRARAQGTEAVEPGPMADGRRRGRATRTRARGDRRGRARRPGARTRRPAPEPAPAATPGPTADAEPAPEPEPPSAPAAAPAEPEALVDAGPRTVGRYIADALRAAGRPVRLHRPGRIVPRVCSMRSRAPGSGSSRRATRARPRSWPRHTDS